MNTDRLVIVLVLGAAAFFGAQAWLAHVLYVLQWRTAW
jgi:hypothetical protein